MPQRTVPQSHPSRRKPSRRWPAVLLVLVSVLLVWFGIQGGIWPGEGQVDSDSAEGPPVDDNRPEVPAGPAGETKSSVLPDVPVDSNPTDPDEPELPAAEIAAAEDRLWGCLRRVEVARAQRDFEAAFEAIGQARALRLGSSQRERLDAAEKGLREHLGRAVSSAVEWVDSGRVLDAAGTLRSIASSRFDAVQRGLTAAWGRSVPTELAADAELPPLPIPLALGQLVRVRHEGSLTEASVVDATGREVTLKLANSVGVVFPTVDRSEVEPQRMSPDLSLDQAVGALHARDGFLAGIWLRWAEAQALQDSQSLEPSRVLAIRRCLR